MQSENEPVLSELVDEAGRLKHRRDRYAERFDIMRNNILNLFSKSHLAAKTNTIEGDDYKATICKQLIVEYDFDKLGEKLDVDLMKEIVAKTYTIENPDGFFEMLKSYGVPPKMIKKYIKSKKDIDKNKIQSLFDTNIISLSDLAGCYTAELKRVVKVAEKHAKL